MLYRNSIALPTLPTLRTLRVGRELDRLFDDVLAPARSDSWAPAVDLREDAKALTFSIDLPGVLPEQVTVTAEQGVLTIAGSRTAEKAAEGTQTHVVERSYGSFRRAFRLPESVDENAVEARFTHGVLTVTVAKKVPVAPRKIEIKTA